MKRKHVYVTILAFALLSCADSGETSNNDIFLKEELTQEDALLILQNQYQGEVCKGDFMSKINSAWGRDEEYQSYKDNCIILEDSGYIAIHENYNERNSYFEMHISIEDRGREDYNASIGSYRGTAVLTHEYPTEVLGMSFSEDKKQTDLVFTVETQATPFYTLALDRGGKNKCPSTGTNEREATLVKYDTGWRLKHSK